MGKKATLNIVQAEQCLLAIQSLGDKKNTTRKFNFALNYNYDELESVLKKAYKSFHKKPDEIKEYEKKMDELITEFMTIGKAEMRRQGIDPTITLIQKNSINAFNEEADRLKEEYKEALDAWDILDQENADMKEDVEVDVEFYVIDSVTVDGDPMVPELEPKIEYWVGHFVDYTRELGNQVPSRKKFKDMKSPSDLMNEAHDEPEEAQVVEESEEKETPKKGAGKKK